MWFMMTVLQQRPQGQDVDLDISLGRTELIAVHAQHRHILPQPLQLFVAP
jgi:hypothetical protein